MGTPAAESAPGTVLLVLCTCPDRDQVARDLAATLTERRLAACVSIVPGLRSMFRWEGCLEQESECLLLAKTTRAAYPRLEQALREQHPYSVPEIIAMPLERGSEAYLSWVRANTLPGTPEVAPEQGTAAAPGPGSPGP